jgi:hypothetical protein
MHNPFDDEVSEPDKAETFTEITVEPRTETEEVKQEPDPLSEY